jgi:glucose/arabinose dehydrogenase
MRTSRLALCCAALVVAACAKKEAPKDTTAAMAPAAAPAPAPAPALAAADVAGTWHFAATPTTGKDTSATTFDLAATADSADWTMTFTKSKLKVPAKHSISGDTLTLSAGPFASQRRKGLKVSTMSVLKMDGGKLVGQTTAHYEKAGADSVSVLRTEGTKAP